MSLRASVAAGLVLALVPGLAAAAELVEIPVPVLDGMDGAVQEQLGRARSELDAMASRDDVPAATLAEAYGVMGQLYLAYDLVQPAGASLANARALAPGDFRWSYLLAALSQTEQDLERAVELFDAALAVRPRDLAALIRLGNVRLDRNEPALAQEVFERALAVDERSAAALAGLGKAQAARGDASGAVASFTRALEIQPAATAVHYPLAMALRELGRIDEARRHLAIPGERVDVHFDDPLSEQLLGLATGAGIRMMYANRALRAGKIGLAVARYREAVASDPRSAAAHQGLGMALAREGDLAAAVREYSAALALDPENGALHYNLGTLLADRGDDAQAVRHFRAALALVPDFTNARFNLATALVRLGQVREARDLYRQVLEVEPEDFPTRYYYAETLARLGEKPAAAEILEALAAEDPERWRVRLSLAGVCLDLGDLERARAELAAVERAGPPAELATVAAALRRRLSEAAGSNQLN